MSAKFRLSPLAILGLVLLVATAELTAGTSLRFVSMVVAAMFSICVTYNMLGGLGTIAGIGFSGFALGTLVVSQVGKAILFEKADVGLDVPGLTITVYAVYFVSLMVGTFAFSRVRLSLPRPAEPETLAQSRYLYLISMVGGVTGTLWLVVLDFAGGNATISLSHGIARALSYLLPFSIVIAVDNRLRSTHGRRFFGWSVVWPSLAMILAGFLYASRQSFVEPLGVIFLACYMRNFKFQRRHAVASIAVGAFFFFLVSPFYLYSRSFRGGSTMTLGEQASTMLRTLQSAPAQWLMITSTVGEQALAAPGTVNYFRTPGAVTLNRFALIGPDSTLINACATGFHYGFTALKLDVLSQIPRPLYPNKPAIGSGGYLGHLDGQESDALETTNSTITPISDSYGAFSWVGVILFSFLVMPTIFVVYESIFDIRRPWGTVATLMLGFGIAAGSMGNTITDVLIKNPIYILVISWCATWIVKMIPVMGDRAVRSRKWDSRPVSSADEPSASAS
jgi:hypothetical protein